MKGVDIRAGAVQAEQLRGSTECVPQRLHPPRHQPGPQEGDATPINLNYVDVDGYLHKLVYCLGVSNGR